MSSSVWRKLTDRVALHSVIAECIHCVLVSLRRRFQPHLVDGGTKKLHSRFCCDTLPNLFVGQMLGGLEWAFFHGTEPLAMTAPCGS